MREVERPEILAAVARAHEMGDVTDNADYKVSRERQREIDREIRSLEAIADDANIIDVESLSGVVVMFGATVIVRDGEGALKTYRILSEYESDLEKGIIANTSPLARALLGKAEGSAVLARTPAGDKEFEIIKVSYGRETREAASAEK